MVLSDRAGELLDGMLPYMLFVYKVHDGWRDRIPRTYVDGTACIRTVDAADEPFGGPTSSAPPRSTRRPSARLRSTDRHDQHRGTDHRVGRRNPQRRLEGHPRMGVVFLDDDAPPATGWLAVLIRRPTPARRGVGGVRGLIWVHRCRTCQPTGRSTPRGWRASWATVSSGYVIRHWCAGADGSRRGYDAWRRTNASDPGVGRLGRAGRPVPGNRRAGAS